MLKHASMHNHPHGLHYAIYDDDIAQYNRFVRDVIQKPTATMSRMIARNPGICDGYTISELYGMQRSVNFIFNTTFGEGVYLKFFIAYDHNHERRRLYYFAKTFSNSTVEFQITLTTTIHRSTVTYTSTATAYGLRKDAPIAFYAYIDEETLYRFQHSSDNSVTIRMMP